LAYNAGEVFYGNIGSRERLDFTVVGPAVNEVVRIAAMCRSVDQPVLSRPHLLMSTPSDGVWFLWDDTRCAVFLMPKSYLRSILLHSP
jgi:class 3 adenylate cyclase